MSVNLTQKDWLQISAYLDGRLSKSELTQVETRLADDTQFKRAFTEIENTRRMLRSLPTKRAPRNFTLSPKKVNMRVRRNWFQPALSFVSATAALALVAVFSFSTLLPNLAARSAAPMMALAPEAAMDSSLRVTSETTDGAPMIIQWNPVNANGGSGGGNGSETMGSLTSNAPGHGGGGVPPAESPSPKALVDTKSDPSTLILGLPEPGTGGEIITRNFYSPEPARPALPVSTLWMIGLAALTLVSGVTAFILRRR